VEKLKLTTKEDGVVDETLVFSREDLLGFLTEIQWRVDPNGTILNESNEVVRCMACQRVVHADDFGAFFPGSVNVVHGDFACFAGGVFYTQIEKLKKDKEK